MEILGVERGRFQKFRFVVFVIEDFLLGLCFCVVNIYIFGVSYIQLNLDYSFEFKLLEETSKLEFGVFSFYNWSRNLFLVKIY